MISDDESNRKYTLKQVLELMDISTAEAAREIGIRRETLSRYLHGKHKTISFTVPQWIRLGRLLNRNGLTFEDLSEDLPDPPP